MVHEDDAPFYEVIDLVCHSCRASGLHAQDVVENNGGRVPPGRFFSAHPKP